MRAIALVVLCGYAMVGSRAQPPARVPSEWVTSGSDAQRSHSIAGDPKISVEGFAAHESSSQGSTAGFQFLWKTKIANEPVQMNSLSAAILLDRYIGYRGFRSFAFVAGSGNTIAAIDTDLSRIEWQKHLAIPASAGTQTCPGGVTSAVTRSTGMAIPYVGAPGRGSYAKSDVGASSEGAVTIAGAMRAYAAANAAPLFARPPERGPQPTLIYLIASDGMLHTINVSNGEEMNPPMEFVPPNSNAQGLVVMERSVAYAVTHACNGAEAGVWGLDLATKQVMRWKPESGDIAGSAGPVFSPDGTIYVATQSSKAQGQLVALSARSLTVRDSYSSQDGFVTSPVVFAYKGRTMVAGGTLDGRVRIFDATNLAQPVAETAADAASVVTGGLATWQVPLQMMSQTGSQTTSQPGAGVRWLVGATDRGVIAWRIAEVDAKAAIERAWPREMTAPLTPMIINGVVFALASGENRDAAMTAAQRAKRSAAAVLYAMDVATGKALWDSGKTIAGFAHSGGLSGGSSQIYLSTYDGTVYAFGFPIEH